ncbi:hypothetical protein ACROYT_G017415 [Oculina patagonica]
MTMKTSYIIQFTVYSVLQGYNVASDIGMFFDVFNAVKKCNELESSSSNINGTQVDPGGTKVIYCREPGNYTLSDLDKHITTLEILQWFFLIFAGIGVGLYIAHLCTLLPNLCKHCHDPEFEHEVAAMDTPKYYRSIVHIHTVFMCLETFVHDIPVSCLAVELSVHYFGPANCWECAVSASSIPAELSLSRSSLWIGLKVSAVALITIYKGILPLYFWIGNPFCWSCYPLRFLIAMPAGLGFMVMVLAPCMGIAKLRVMVEVPDLESTVAGPSDIIFMIGLVFWVILIVGFLAYKIFYSFIMELCPCLAWCQDDDKNKKKDKEEKTTGCLCF